MSICFSFSTRLIEWLFPWSTRSIRNKILFSIVLVFCVVYGGTLTYVYQKSRKDLFNFAQREALSTARLLAITLYRSYEIETDFREIQSYVSGVKRSKDSIIEINVYGRDGAIVSSTEEDKLFNRDPSHRLREQASHFGRVELLPIDGDKIQLKGDMFLRAIHPVAAGFSEDGVAEGVVEVQSSMGVYLNQLRRIREGILIAGVVIIVVISLVVVIIARTITRPIDSLYLGMIRANEGDLDVSVAATTLDEVGYLTRTFNDMILSLKSSRSDLERYAGKLSELHVASKRFVPEQFLELLEKQDITDVALGDSKLKEMTVLFADIRSFTEIAHTCATASVLELLNSILNAILPAIEEHHGFVDKYIGDSIMALFPRSADDAVRSALAIQERLLEFNASREDKISLGVGINSGELILGTVGSEDRLDTTVIGDTVNVASRLESLTKQHGVSIVISAKVYGLCSPSLKGEISLVELGTSEVRGIEQPVRLYGIG